MAERKQPRANQGWLCAGLIGVSMHILNDPLEKNYRGSILCRRLKGFAVRSVRGARLAPSWGKQEYGLVDVQLGAQEMRGRVDVIEGQGFVVFVDEVIQIPFRVGCLLPYRVTAAVRTDEP